ncbi:MAG: hypothetical protein ACFFD5_10720 [Candidatus Thorarchaeota archaeon]
MSFGKLNNHENSNSKFVINTSNVIIPFSKFFNKETRNDIYDGNEKIPFNKKHPIFKALMRIEFEDAMRKFHNIK